MTDREFIYNFLEKNYTAKVGISSILIMDNFSAEEISTTNFKSVAITQLGEYSTDEGHTSDDIIQSWLFHKIDEITRGLKNYLHSCTVKLTRVGWDIINPEGKPTTLNNMKGIFSERFNTNYLESYVEEWYSNKVCEETEKIMNSY